eukprot:1067360-Karenia_brevis.AAC.1
MAHNISILKNKKGRKTKPKMEFIWKAERVHTSKIKFIDNKRKKRKKKSEADPHYPPSRVVYR